MISVIIPAYNCSKTVERCVNSVLNQSYKSFELIIVNDASTDDTLEKLYALKERDCRIKVIDAPHGGVSRARNTGLSEAKGEFVQFVDADDELRYDALEIMHSLVNEYSADMAVCRFSHPYFYSFVEDGVFDLESEEDFLKFYQNTFNMVTPWNRLIRRSVIVKNFDESVAFSEDELFNFTNLKNIRRVVGTSELLYNYYVAQKDEGSSCISDMLGENKFWENKTSIWYMGERLFEKRRQALNEWKASAYLPLKDENEILYGRIFDYMPWEILAYAGSGVSKEGLVKEIYNVFNEEGFKRSAKIHSRYGLHYVEYEGEELLKRVERFVSLAYEACRRIEDEGNGVKKYEVVCHLLLELFFEKRLTLNTVNLYARLKNQYDTCGSAEARFSRELLLA